VLNANDAIISDPVGGLRVGNRIFVGRGHLGRSLSAEPVPAAPCGRVPGCKRQASERRACRVVPNNTAETGTTSIGWAGSAEKIYEHALWAGWAWRQAESERRHIGKAGELGSVTDRIDRLAGMIGSLLGYPGIVNGAKGLWSR
jgi:hypothetical protein